MRDGEITGFKYGNPRAGQMQQLKEATVKVVSVSGRKAVIHLRLKADLDPVFDFDVDEEFSLDVKAMAEE